MAPDADKMAKPGLSYSGYARREEGTFDRFIVETGPGSPGGEYLRRFWQPVAFLSELKDLPRRQRIMGEDLVVFRDRSGQVGVLHLHCCHRGTSLEYGQIEHRGIRCCYHGRVYDVDGTILEMPGEPHAALYQAQVAQGAYPTHVFNGMVFAYMGPPEKKPPFPNYDCFNVPGMDMVPGVRLPFPCNWVQIKENAMDPAHTATLHALPGNPFGITFGVFPELDFFETPAGMIYVGTRRVNDKVWVRSTDVLMPNIHCVSSIREEGRDLKRVSPPWMTIWTVPVDDENSITFPFRHIAKNTQSDIGEGNRVLKDTAEEQRRVNLGIGLGQTGDRPYEERQRVPGDYDAMISQGAIPKHSKENLGTLDRGVTMFRRMLRRSIEAVQRGEDPPYLYRLDGTPTPTYGTDRVVPLEELGGDPEDPRVLKAFGEKTAREYLAHPPLQALG